jgi:hypothetical protein
VGGKIDTDGIGFVIDEIIDKARELGAEGFDGLGFSHKRDIFALSHPDGSFWIIFGANSNRHHGSIPLPTTITIPW